MQRDGASSAAPAMKESAPRAPRRRGPSHGQAAYRRAEEGHRAEEQALHDPAEAQDLEQVLAEEPAEEHVAAEQEAQQREHAEGHAGAQRLGVAQGRVDLGQRATGLPASRLNAARASREWP